MKIAPEAINRWMRWLRLRRGGYIITTRPVDVVPIGSEPVLAPEWTPTPLQPPKPLETLRTRALEAAHRQLQLDQQERIQQMRSAVSQGSTKRHVVDWYVQEVARLRDTPSKEENKRRLRCPTPTKFAYRDNATGRLAAQRQIKNTKNSPVYDGQELQLYVCVCRSIHLGHAISKRYREKDVWRPSNRV